MLTGIFGKEKKLPEVIQQSNELKLEDLVKHQDESKEGKNWK